MSNSMLLQHWNVHYCSVIPNCFLRDNCAVILSWKLEMFQSVWCVSKTLS